MADTVEQAEVPHNRYLEAGFAPVADEVTATDLRVTGTLPPELVGRYVRTGPNPIAADPSNHHWFVGEGMVHGVSVAGGRAGWYRNRWVRGPEVSRQLGEDPVPLVDGGWHAGDGNTNVVHHAGMLLALEEGSCPYALDAELATLRQVDFGGPLPAGTNAHPKFDPVTGELHVMAYSWAPPFLRYHVVDPGGRLVHTEEAVVGGPVMVHDMALTERWALALDLPVVFDMELAAAGRPLPYRWDPDHPARVGLVPRAGAAAGSAPTTVWVDVDPCYVFHPLNAYDDGDTVVVDVVRHPSMFAVDRDGPDDGPSRLERWVLDSRTGRSTATVVDDAPQEFPRADERLAGRRHRYGWTAGTTIGQLGATASTDEANAVFKHDLVAGTTRRRDLGAGRVGGEFVFVPSTAASGEDEGWLLGYVNDLPSGTAELVVLDATDLSDVARVHLPRRIPAGFHGNWIPDAAVTP